MIALWVMVTVVLLFACALAVALGSYVLAAVIFVSPTVVVLLAMLVVWVRDRR